jgi:hypothetical protein
MNWKHLAGLIAITLLPVGVMAKPGNPGTSTSPIVLESVPDRACRPYCVEVAFSRAVGHVFLVNSRGKKRLVTTYFPNWAGEKAAPAEGEWYVTRTVSEQRYSGAKGANTCGTDGWGFVQGETVFASNVPGGATTSGTYTGGGQMAVTTVYPNGGGNTQMQESGFKPDTNAGSNPACEQMRLEYEQIPKEE